MLQGGFLVGFMWDFVSSFLLAFWLLQFFVQTLYIKPNLKKTPMKNILIQMCQKTALPKMFLIPLRSGKERANTTDVLQKPKYITFSFFCLIINIKYLNFIFLSGFSTATKAPRDLELTPTYDVRLSLFRLTLKWHHMCRN